MRRVVERAVRHTPGGDLLFGAVGTALGVAIWYCIETAAATRTIPPAVAAVRAVGAPVAVLVSALVLVGILARVGRDETTGAEPTTSRVASVPDGRLPETARLTVAPLRDRGGTLLVGAVVAVLASLLVGAFVALVLLAVVLSALTVAGYTAYAFGHGQLVSAVTMFHVSGVLVGVGIAAGVVSVRFFDCVVCWTDAGPIGAVRESIRFSRQQPLTVIGYTLFSAVLFAIPVGAAGLVGQVHEPLGLGVLVVLTTTSVALYANVHAQVCSQRLLPVCCEPVAAEASEPQRSPAHTPIQSHTVPSRPLVANPLAIVLALMLVTALLVGNGSVRALDVRPAESPDEPGPIEKVEDATALLDADALPQTETNYRAVETAYEYNESQDQWETVVAFEHEVDHQQRRTLVTMTIFEADEPTQSNTAYFSTKQFAMQWVDHQDPQPASSGADHAWHQRTAGSWLVYSVAGDELLDEESEPVTVEPGFFKQDWDVVDHTSETVTLEAAGPAAVPLRDDGHGEIERADIEVVLDRETGYISSVSQELERADDDIGTIRTTFEFEEWGDHTVSRPDEIEVQAVEWVWGVASY